jgi:hypothetical protein
MPTKRSLAANYAKKKADSPETAGNNPDAKTAKKVPVLCCFRAICCFFVVHLSCSCCFRAIRGKVVFAAIK